MKQRTMKWACGLVVLAAISGAALAAECLVSLKFTPGGWDPAAWTLCKNPGVDHLGKWVQREDCVENETPTDRKTQALDQTLTTMIYNTKFKGDFTATATFEIGAGSAPGIIIAQDFAPDAQGRPQYGEFYEVIIYEKGLNLWHHFAKDGKRTYEKTAYSDFALKPDTRYKLEVRRQKQSVEMSVDGHIVGVLINSLSDEVYLGVEGCEGVSRVYDFSVSR